MVTDKTGKVVTEAEQEAFDSVRPHVVNDEAAWRLVALMKDAIIKAWEKIIWETGTTKEGISLINSKKNETT